MIKVMLADDDFLVRMFLKQLTNWERAGYEIVGDACNGVEALKLFEQYRPELIITDLCMPAMNGIELIRKVKSIEPATRVVVLSCHDEFEYVREAMQLGADDYVLKNILDETELLRQLEVMRAKIEQTSVQAQRQKELQRLARMGTDLLRQELVERLRLDALTDAEQHKLMRDAGITGEFPACAALLAIGRGARGNAVQEVCQQYCRGRAAEVVEWLSDGCCIFLDVSAYGASERQEQAVMDFAQGLERCIRDYLNIEPELGASRVHTGSDRLKTAVSQAHAALQACFYAPGIRRYDSQLTLNAQWPKSAVRFLNAFAQTIAECRIDDILVGGSLALDAFQSECIAPDAIARWFVRLDAEAGFDGAADQPVNLAACRKRIQEYAEIVRQRSGIRTNACGNRTIESALEYIRLHYTEPISLTQVADAVHLNSAYLSHLFKQETGVNFSDYLLSSRMGKVKELILSSDKALNQVAAQAGFVDYRNFCKLFKRETGMRPAEFRNRKI